VTARLATTAIGSTFKDQSATSALHAAEAGLNHLMHAVARNPGYNTGQRLPPPQGRPNFGDQGERGWVLAQAAASRDLLELTSGQAVFIKPLRGDGTRGNVLYGVGYVPNRTAGRGVRVVKVEYTEGIVPNVAVLTEGDLVVNGNPTISGSLGSVHTNANLSVLGNPTIAHNATATGTYTQQGNPTIGGISGGGRPRMRIPTITLELFRGLADYELRRDGKVYAGQSGAAGLPGMLLWDTANGPFRGWRRDSSGTWSLSGNEDKGTYYIEGDAAISGNPGSRIAPWQASVFATGSIKVSGTPVMTAATKGLGLVAGGHLDITGNAQQRFNGALLARGRLAISGNPEVIGYIIAASAATTSAEVTGTSRISGNIRITYDGRGEGVPGGITVDRWQELVQGLY
jgi:hypothetical protein